LLFTKTHKKMSENKSITEPGTQSQDMRKDYENPAGDNSTIIENNERATPNEFPERSHQHDYKDPSANQFENDDEDDDDMDTDTEIFNQDEDESADPVDEQGRM